MNVPFPHGVPSYALSPHETCGLDSTGAAAPVTASSPTVRAQRKLLALRCVPQAVLVEDLLFERLLTRKLFTLRYLLALGGASFLQTYLKDMLDCQLESQTRKREGR